MRALYVTFCFIRELSEQSDPAQAPPSSESSSEERGTILNLVDALSGDRDTAETRRAFLSGLYKRYCDSELSSSADRAERERPRDRPSFDTVRISYESIRQSLMKESAVEDPLFSAGDWTRLHLLLSMCDTVVALRETGVSEKEMNRILTSKR